jgi:L-fuculose-phosphate aldolase
LTLEVESLAQQYWTALQLGEPHILSSRQMQAVMEKFKSYGPGASA